ncbi:uncharacterized protein LOC124283622 [Haliotis rubra]|uniref:uncharacterized protein LOC124283622 n=1 Tax=Haliotis rubra TaxID=36100 RepID=UPI001EE51C79|nr:uncharacterized protein LOC124283622 [Haliotis rubra]
MGVFALTFFWLLFVFGVGDSHGILEINTGRIGYPDGHDCEEMPPSSPTVGADSEPSRLLVARYSYRGTPPKEIRLADRSVRDYPFLNSSQISSLAYVSQLRRLLVAIDNPYAITSYTLDAPEDMVTLRRHIRTNAMAVDQGRQLVFLSAYHPLYSICRMTPQGGEFQYVLTQSRYDGTFIGVTVDPATRTVFTAFRTKLLSVNYDGEHLQTLFTGEAVYAVNFDPVDHTLYFNHNENVMKMLPGSTEPTQVHELEYVPFTFAYYNSSLYVGSYAAGDVGVIRLGNRSVEYEELLQVELTFRVSVCLLP